MSSGASRSKRLLGGSVEQPRASVDLARNGGRARYRATAAERRAGRCRRREEQTRFPADPALAARVAAPAAEDSPVTLLGHSRPRARRSHETISEGIYADGRRGLAAGLHTHLHQATLPRAPPGRGCPGERPARSAPSSSTTRPEIASLRSEVGQAEAI